MNQKKEHSSRINIFILKTLKKTDYCDEFETKIEKADQIEKIFRSIDIKETVVVEKTRSTWMYKEVEVAIDEVKNLGTFIELEATVHHDDPKVSKKGLYKGLEDLKAEVGEEDLRGYPYLIWESKNS